MKYKIIDNFLEEAEFKTIQQTLLGNDFPWYFNQGVTYQDLSKDYLHNFQFVHKFWNVIGRVAQSEWAPLLDPIITKIDPAIVLRIKANLMPVTAERIVHQLHTDLDHIKCTTAVLYLNTNNGATIFEDGSEVQSVANRLIYFDSTVRHTSASCTDKKARCVINFNYIEKGLWT
jgi:hypothetical protein